MEIFSSNFSENIPGLELAELVSLLGALALASIRAIYPRWAAPKKVTMRTVYLIGQHDQIVDHAN